MEVCQERPDWEHMEPEEHGVVQQAEEVMVAKVVDQLSEARAFMDLQASMALEVATEALQDMDLKELGPLHPVLLAMEVTAMLAGMGQEAPEEVMELTERMVEEEEDGLGLLDLAMEAEVVMEPVVQELEEVLMELLVLLVPKLLQAAMVAMVADLFTAHSAM